MNIQLLHQVPRTTQPQTFFLAKKGKRYITHRNGELALSDKQSAALVLPDDQQLTHFLEQLAADDRNAQVLGRSYVVTDVTIPPAK